MKMKIRLIWRHEDGHIKLPDIILLSLQVSGIQLIELGVSDKDVLEQYNLVWIITDYDIDIVRCLVLLNLHWNRHYNRLFCYRRFTIYDEAGEIIHGSYLCPYGSWESKVHQVPEIVTPYQSEFSKKLVRGPKYTNGRSDKQGLSRSFLWLRYENGHVNNSKYLDWIFGHGSRFPY